MDSGNVIDLVEDASAPAPNAERKDEDIVFYQ
jgi:hypothetical protein